MACYLVFDVANLGMLVAHWSEEPVEGALAIVHPGKAVPKFKFRQHGGRVEIVRKIREDIRKLYMGWAEFVKMAIPVEGTFELLEPRGVTITLNQFGQVVPVQPEEHYTIADFGAVAICGKDNDPFQSVKTMINSQFLDIGVKHGHSLALV